MGKESRRNGGPVLTNPFKKRNEGPAEPFPPAQPEPEVAEPTELPPLSAFMLRNQGLSWNEKSQGWALTQSGEVDIPRTIYAHGLSVDDTRMIRFTVFFFVEIEGKRHAAQAPKLVINAEGWTEVEELNDLFPQAPKAGLFH